MVGRPVADELCFKRLAHLARNGEATPGVSLLDQLILGTTSYVSLASRSWTQLPIHTLWPDSLAGSPLDVLGGDRSVGKAVASVLLAHPVLDQLQVFNTHASRL